MVRPVMTRQWLPFTDGARLEVLARQFSRFLAAGVAATAVHYGVLIALVETWNLHPVLATTIGFVAAVLLSYVLNRRFTFDTVTAFGPGLLKYYGAVSVGLAVNAGVVAVLSLWGVPYLLAQVVATVAAFVCNFLAARFVVFR
jgi:putative flippase GtrA